MSSRANATPEEPQTQANTLTGRLLFVLALLAAIGTLSTNIILPPFASIAHSMAVPVRDVGLLLSSFFITGVAMRYGYARVSSNTQDYAAQVEALKTAEGQTTRRAGTLAACSDERLARLPRGFLISSQWNDSSFIVRICHRCHRS